MSRAITYGPLAQLRSPGRLDVVHLRFMDAGVPFLEALDALIDLKKEGKIRHLALSNVSAPQVEAA